MAAKKHHKPNETASQQHKRFVETAKKLEASEAPEDFDRAFKRVTRARDRQGRDERSH